MRRTVLWLTFWLVFQGLGMSYGLWWGWHNAHEHAELVRAEVAEDEVEQAKACVDAHERYGNFLVLAERLTRAGALVGTDAHLALLEATPGEEHAAHLLIDELLPERVEPIIEAYPPPECDVDAAERRLNRAG